MFTRFYALLRAFISVKQFTPFTPFTVYSVYTLLRSGLHNEHPLKLVATAPFTPSTIANHFFGKDSVDIFEKMKSYLKAQLFNASSSSTVSQKQKRVFVFKLFLCNPFARSAGIFLSFVH